MFLAGCTKLFCIETVNKPKQVERYVDRSSEWAQSSRQASNQLETTRFVEQGKQGYKIKLEFVDNLLIQRATNSLSPSFSSNQIQ